MCSTQSIVGRSFAFMPLLPSKDKTGLIACVGVDASMRGKGVGLALLIKAMQTMRARGIEGVLIDWVTIRGFYERLGFEVFWEYEKYDF
jgi:beta-N-acetylhexosaminidase